MNVKRSATTRDRSALILEDGLSRQALTASRALGRADWTVGVGAELARGMAASSRSTSSDHRVPAPEHDLDGFIAATNEAITAVGYDLVFGARDVELLALSSRRHELETELPYPPHERVVRALDKLELATAAQRVGIASPATRPATDDAIAQVDRPVVVKARLHAPLDGVPRPARVETTLARTAAQAGARAREIRSQGGEPLLQEALPGALEEVAVVADREGRLAARVHQTVQRVSAPGAGVAVRATTRAPDEGLMDRIRALIAELGWWGLAELQFIVGPEGEHRLIDFNGRFYGSLALAIGAGVNLPAIWASVALGETADAVTARPGVRYQWLTGDIRSCLNSTGESRVRMLAQSARWAPGAVQSVISVRDPLPACRALMLDSSRVLGRRLRGDRSSNGVPQSATPRRS